MTTFFSLVFQWVLIALALLGGVAAGSHAQFIDDWKITLISLGALSLGFGAAVLVYRHLGNSQTNDLAQGYRDLTERAGLLLKDAELFEQKLDSQRNTVAN